MYIPNFNYLAQFGGEIEKELHFFKVKKGGIPITPLLIDLGGRFLDMTYNL